METKSQSFFSGAGTTLPPLPGARYAVDDAVDSVPRDAAGVHDLVGRGGVDDLEHRERVALQLDRAAVPPFTADGAHVPLQHQHLEPLPPGGEREHQPADAAAGHQDARLGPWCRHCRAGHGRHRAPRAARREADPSPRRGRGGEREQAEQVEAGVNLSSQLRSSCVAQLLEYVGDLALVIGLTGELGAGREEEARDL
ncbi:hypothetical protein GQ55_7G160500 [Panicum hallii var. hallii]|uniref:Uncharacterized protein n=1 Tax=Panicum hallii var. hallii TaxID=1504633 RepID=A0A2T7CVN0_9POAL|nr:hypothetical protein GQ55_7G160500 [Panicum hallii var. hallii]